MITQDLNYYLNLSHGKTSYLTEQELDKEKTELLMALRNPIYKLGNIGGRKLQVPSKVLKQAHKVLHLILCDCLPNFKGTHSIKNDVETTLKDSPEYTCYIKTDIKSCFQNISEKDVKLDVLPFVNNTISKSLPKTKQNELSNFLTLSLNSLFNHTLNGLSTGSPASPATLELVLRDFPQSTKGKTIRYVDDLLILGTEEDCQQSLDTISTYLNKKGLSLNKDKTTKGKTHDSIPFLGYTFSSKSRNTKQPIPIPVKTFFPVKEWEPNLELLTDQNDPSYSNDRGTIGYRADSIYESMNKGSIEALILSSCSSKVSKTKNFHTNSNLLLENKAIFGIHKRLYGSYTKTIKKDRDSGKKVNQADSEKILCGLSTIVFAMSKGRFPQNYSELKKFYKSPPTFKKVKGFDLDQAFKDSNTASGVYHDAIKDLFKMEYQYRVNKLSKIQKNSPILDELSMVDDPVQELINKDFTRTQSKSNPAIDL